ncbi:MAG: serine hydrolase [Olegusella sp.]|nr:serine hydrolase [Olegusella sp.]
MRRGTLPFATAAVGMTLAASLSACTPSSPAATSGSGGEIEVSDAALAEDEGSEADLPLMEEETSTAVDARAIAHELVADAELARKFDGSQAYADFAAAVGTIEDSGHRVSVAVVRPDGGEIFSYNADQTYYSASAIKAPFVAALYETQIETGNVSLGAVDGLARATIVDSDNDSYDALRGTYWRIFAPWLEKYDVDLGTYANYNEMSAWFYLTLSPRQLAQMWVGVYSYLSASQSEAAGRLRGYLEQRTTTALGDALGGTYATWGKAGWFHGSEGYGSAPCANDAGVVFAEEPYIVVVMSDVPGDLTQIEPVFTAVDELHGLCAD